MFLAPLIAVFIIYGRSALGGIDWRLVRTTAWLYVGALAIYGSVHFVRAAWKCDLARQREIAHRDALLVQAEREFGQMVASKDSERAATLAEIKAQLNADFSEATQHWIGEVAVRDSEIVELKRTLAKYKVVWPELQSRARELAIDLREYCELTGPEPTPPLIAGERAADFLERQVKLRLPWMDKVTYEYEKDSEQSSALTLEQMEAQTAAQENAARASQTATNNAERNIEIAQNSFRDEQRAWVGMSSEEVTSFDANNPIGIKIVFFNSGRTPARNVKLVMNVSLPSFRT